jgi:hypothetical protein
LSKENAHAASSEALITPCNALRDQDFAAGVNVTKLSQEFSPAVWE